MKTYFAGVAGLALALALALVCVGVAAQSESEVVGAVGAAVALPTRPAPPSHGRFAHVAAQQLPRTRSARGASGAPGVRGASEAVPARRFAHTMVLDLAGQDVTAQHAAALGQSEAEAAAWADAHTPRGLSLLRYDVELQAHARILDEDFNVLAVQCAKHGEASVALTLTVTDVQQALNSYVQGTTVQGSTMWACKNPNPSPADNPKDDWTILVSVSSVIQVDAHTLQLVGALASYQDLFGHAEMLLRQPSLQPTPGQAIPRSPAGRHALAIEQPLSVGVETEHDAALGAVESVVRQQQPARHAARLLDNELKFSEPGPNQHFRPDANVRLTFTGFRQIRNWTDRSKIKLRQWRVIKGTDGDATIGPQNGLFPPPCKQPQASPDSCSVLIPLSAFGAEVVPSVRPYYFDITYCRDSAVPLVSDCETSSTPMFWLPVSQSGKFAGDIPVLEKSCATLKCPAAPASTKPTTTTPAPLTPIASAAAALLAADRELCKLCQQGRDFSFTVGCVGCSLSYTAQVSVFSFAYSLDPVDLYVKAEAVIDALLDANIDMRAKLQLKGSSAGAMQIINTMPIPPSLTIPLGVVSITIGAWLDLFAGYSAAFDASATVRATTEVSNVVTARAVFNTKLEPDTTLSGTIPPFVFSQQPTVSVSASGQGQIDLFLRPMVTVGIQHLIKATAKADVFATLSSLFSFPAFPALKAPKGMAAVVWYDKDPNRPAYAHVGSCSQPHQMRYSVEAGMRAGRVSARIEQNIGSAISPSLARFDETRELGGFDLHAFSLPLVSGCLLPQAGTQPAVTTLKVPAALKQGRNFSVALRTDLPNLVNNVALDLAQALNTSAARFALALYDAAGNLIDEQGRVQLTREQQAAGQPLRPALPTLPPVPPAPKTTNPNVIQAAQPEPARTSATEAPTHGKVPVLFSVTADPGEEADSGADAESESDPQVLDPSAQPLGGEVASVHVTVLGSDDPAEPSAEELQAQMRAQLAEPDSPLRQAAATGQLTYVDESADDASSGNAASQVGLIVGVVLGVLLGVALGALLAFYLLVWRPKHTTGAATAASDQSTAINLGAVDSSASAQQLQAVAAADVEVLVAPADSPQPSPEYNAMQSPVSAL